jgi:hypothetical protein
VGIEVSVAIGNCVIGGAREATGGEAGTGVRLEQETIIHIIIRIISFFISPSYYIIVIIGNISILKNIISKLSTFVFN